MLRVKGTKFQGNTTFTSQVIGYQEHATEKARFADWIALYMNQHLCTIYCAVSPISYCSRIAKCVTKLTTSYAYTMLMSIL